MAAAAAAAASTWLWHLVSHWPWKLNGSLQKFHAMTSHRKLPGHANNRDVEGGAGGVCEPQLKCDIHGKQSGI